ncbi:MAG TPA: hypothetical protein VFA39_20160 [Steroidobacteraceae bacterium]|nr:hypothetical protein [Steroidobacteraceae bacterium]
MPVEDPLRSLAEVHSPDPRRQFIVGTLADEHAALSTICLHDGVPEPVAQLFETAKNVSLYSWFVYRFHPVSESVGFGALELALNLRKTGLLLLPDDFRSPGLSKLLREAVENGWIRDQEFPSRPAYAQHAAHLAAIAKIIEAGTPSVSLQDVIPGDMDQGLEAISLTKHILELWPKVRNTLAHGSPRLTPNSRRTLRLVAESINQLFEQKKT